MEVAAALTAPWILPSAPRHRITVSRGLGHPGLHRCSLFLYPHDRRLTVKSSLRVPTSEHFGEPNKLTKYLHMLSETLWKSLPEPVKDFPWKQAEDLVFHRLLHLGKKALKWSLVSFLFVSFASDVILSFSRNMELMIPLGLFIGITVADFLVETSKELLKNSIKDLSFGKQLLGIGTIFACIKLVTPYITLPGRMVLSHISNGGLMQVLWLAKDLQGTEHEKEVESPSSSEQVDSHKAVG